MRINVNFFKKFLKLPTYINFLQKFLIFYDF